MSDECIDIGADELLALEEDEEKVFLGLDLDIEPMEYQMYEDPGLDELKRDLDKVDKLNESI
jgi:hypothetical protein